MPISVATRADEADKHSSDVTILLYHKNKLYSGANDGKIKVWRDDLTLVKTIDAHSRAIMALSANDDTLYSCSSDGTVKEWSLYNLQKKGTILIDKNEIWTLCYNDDTLYVGDNEGTLKVFVNDKLAAHINLAEPVKDMMVIGNLVYTVRDLNLVINEVYSEDAEGLGKTQTLPGRAPMCIAADKICFAGRNGKDILVHENSVDLQFKEFAQTKDAHETTINSFCGVENEGRTLLYSGGGDQILKQWRITKNSIKKINECRLDMVINVVTAGKEGQLFIGGSYGQLARVDVCMRRASAALI